MSAPVDTDGTGSLEAQLAAEERLAVMLGDYEGRWVAVAEGQVVAVATTLAALLEVVDEVMDDRRSVEVFEVVSGPVFATC